jgi:nucleoside-diphosphate-sugar epimerase
MKILVVGASQGTGALCVKSALAKGHQVGAFSRSPAKLEITHPALTKIAGDFHDAASVRQAITGHDAVIITAAPKNSAIKETPDYFSRGTKYCIDAMKEHGVKRLVVLTSFDTGDSEPLLGWFLKVVPTSELVSVPLSISRADLANFMVEACESPKWVGKAVHLGG